MIRPAGRDKGLLGKKTASADTIKRIVKKTPVVRDLARMVMRWRAARHDDAFDSAHYWESRYRGGRNSGSGSYNRLAVFKAEIINRFVADHGVKSVIEFGCGDGSQLRLAQYPSYIGVDVAPAVIEANQIAFAGDHSRSFIHIDDVGPKHISDLSLSLDVIYHLVEDTVFNAHMDQLFAFSRHHVIIYSSNLVRASDSIHVRHRRFTEWVERNCPDFRQVGFVKNAYPESVKDLDNTSFADFYFFKRVADAYQK